MVTDIQQEQLVREALLHHGNPESLAARLAHFARERGLSPDDLAAYLGLSRGTLALLAQCRLPEDEAAVEALCRAFLLDRERFVEVLRGAAHPPESQ